MLELLVLRFFQLELLVWRLRRHACAIDNCPRQRVFQLVLGCVVLSDFRVVERRRADVARVRAVVAMSRSSLRLRSRLQHNPRSSRRTRLRTRLQNILRASALCGRCANLERRPHSPYTIQNLTRYIANLLWKMRERAAAKHNADLGWGGGWMGVIGESEAGWGY